MPGTPNAPGQLINHGVSVGHIQVRMNEMKDPGTFLPIASGAHERRLLRP